MAANIQWMRPVMTSSNSVPAPPYRTINLSARLRCAGVALPNHAANHIRPTSAASPSNNRSKVSVPASQLLAQPEHTTTTLGTEIFERPLAAGGVYRHRTQQVAQLGRAGSIKPAIRAPGRKVRSAIGS